MATSSSFFPAISNGLFTSFNQPPKPHSKTTISTLSSSKSHLLSLISDQNRGITTQSDPQKLSQITQTIDTIALINRDQITTNDSLSGTWRLLWTTEKEQLFIVENAGFFGTKAGDVLQVIDVEKRNLNNVITFPPHGVFFVRSGIDIASSQRVDFRYTNICYLISLLNISILLMHGNAILVAVPVSETRRKRIRHGYAMETFPTSRNVSGEVSVRFR